MILQKDTAAPDFSLFSDPDKRVSLSDFKGKNLILCFYPADWSPVCSDQLALYNESINLFSEYDAAIVGISVDSRWCHKAFMENRNLKVPLLADFEPKGEVSRRYGVYNEERGESQRALFVIDGEGKIRWSHLSPDETNPGADGILEALEMITGKSE